MKKIGFGLVALWVATSSGWGQINADVKRPKGKGILHAIKLDHSLTNYIASIKYSSLSGYKPEVVIKAVALGLTHVSFTFRLEEQVVQDDWQVVVTPAFAPEFNWSPHLTPTDEHIIDQHSFRSPAMIATDRDHYLAIVPDLKIMQQGTPVRWYLDSNASNNQFVLGMSNTLVSDHVLYKRAEGACYPKGEVSFGFYLFTGSDQKAIRNPFRPPQEFLWKNWGSSLYTSDAVSAEMDRYVEHTYNWAFKTWKDSLWQEFDVGGKRVGAPALVVYVTQSPNFPGTKFEPDLRAVFNQAWYSAQRSANGLMRYTLRTGNEELKQYAEMTKEFSLAAPMQDGFFYTVAATEMIEFELPENNQVVSKSAGWETLYWGNSRYFPGAHHNVKDAPFHILDMSWTCKLLLEWYDELEKDKRLLEFSQNYANKLLSLQNEQGYFPAWIGQDGTVYKELLDSPENAMSATFLLKLYALTQDSRYKESAMKALHALMDSAFAEGRWEDFETYWSCSRWGTPGKKVIRNNMYKANTLSMYYAADAMMAAYRLTGEQEYLARGQKYLDEMLMYQSVWHPPFMDVNVFGGFGVMNGDGEWLDARQNLFAELILDYGKELKMEEYKERGLAALKASFSMMYCPENPSTNHRYESMFPY
ncbi:MAG: hypothetical protein JRC99_12515, partial [Deltaproteobacteria bacterium]|nr:hypothetical protein [Deltaproteobacteria bacterium]